MADLPPWAGGGGDVTAQDLADAVNALNTTLTVTMGAEQSDREAEDSALDARLLALETAPSSSGLQTAIGNSIMAIGDSITAQDSPSVGGAEFYESPPLHGRSYLFWTVLASEGRLRFRGVSATPGMTSQQILDTHLPVVLAADPAPGFCAVLAGRNPDTGGLATTKANLVEIYTQILEAGILPIACTMPPADIDLATALEHELQAWITTNAARMNIPLADFYTPLVTETGGYSTTAGGTPYGFEPPGDAVHPSAAGAKVMGSVLWEAVKDRVGAPPWILPAQGAADTTSAFPNPLFLVDTDANGRPDGWGGPAGAPTITNPTAAWAPGKTMKVQMNAGSEVFMYGDTDHFPVTAGHRYLIAFRLAAAVQDGDDTTDSWELTFNNQDVSGSVIGIGTDRDIDPGSAFAVEVIIPAGWTALKPLLHINGTGNGYVQFGQFTVVDLTALGLP